MSVSGLHLRASVPGNLEKCARTKETMMYVMSAGDGLSEERIACERFEGGRG